MRAITLVAVSIAMLGISAADAAQLVFSPGGAINPQFPERALSEEVQGDVRIKCLLNAKGRLTDCEVSSELPEGYEFGRTAVLAARRARIDIAASGLEASVGKAVILPVSFRLEGADSVPSEPAGLDIFAEGAALEPEDRAAEQIPPGTPPGSACPDGQDCGVAY
jgi:TonB family protein